MPMPRGARHGARGLFGRWRLGLSRLLPRCLSRHSPPACQNLRSLPAVSSSMSVAKKSLQLLRKRPPLRPPVIALRPCSDLSLLHGQGSVAGLLGPKLPSSPRARRLPLELRCWPVQQRADTALQQRLHVMPSTAPRSSLPPRRARYSPASLMPHPVPPAPLQARGQSAPPSRVPQTLLAPL